MKQWCKILVLSLLTTIASMGNIAAQTDTMAISQELLMAAYGNSIDSILLLLKKGAKINYSDQNGQTSLFYAIQNRNLDMVKILEYNGADLNKQNNDGTTPLSAAAWFGYFYIAEYLCFKGALVNQSDNYGAIPLHYAVYQGDYFMADMLLFYKSDANNITFDKNTSLHLAALIGDTAIINLLLAHGAKPEMENREGLTPIEMAIENHHPEVMKWLFQADSISEFTKPESNFLLNLALKVDADTCAELLIKSPHFIPLKKNDIQNPYNTALALEKYKFKPSMKEHGYSSGFWPSFLKMSMMSTFVFNKDDHFFGFQMGALDVKYHINLSLGFGSRFSRKPVMVPLGNNSFYQLNEKRNYFDFEIKKYFLFYPYLTNISAFVGIDFQSHFGNYSGINRKLEKRFTSVPKAGIRYSYQPFIMEIAYNYINNGLYDFSSHFVSLGFGYNINFVHSQSIYTPYWL